MSSPANGASTRTIKILTAIAAVLALCLLVTSMFFVTGTRSRKAEADQTRTDTQSLRDKKKETETQTTDVRAKHRHREGRSKRQDLVQRVHVRLLQPVAAE